MTAARVSTWRMMRRTRAVITTSDNYNRPSH
jgi:hypothetical protein